MAKELPYFRFTVAEWLNDDISLESYHLQGIFISVCAFYWFQDCSITKAKLKKRFSDAQGELEDLLKLGIIKEGPEDFISIKFLDQQFDMLSEKRRKRVEAGRKGGLARSKQSSSKAKAMPKQSSSYKDKDKDKDKDNNTPDPSGSGESDQKSSSPKDRNKKYLPISKYLAKIIQQDKNYKITSQKLKSWSNDIRLLHEQDGVPPKEMKKVLQWYKKNIGGDYIPVVHSGSSFRQKWLKLVDAMERNSQKRTNNHPKPSTGHYEDDYEFREDDATM